MLRRLTVVVLTGFLVLLGGPAHAAPTTTTNTAHGVVETFVDVAPSCDGSGALYTITTTSNMVEHETVFPDGSVHTTFTQTGTFTATPLNDPTLPSYTGKFTTWDGFNMNGSTVTGTDTFNVRGTGSDGSTLSNHAVGHFNQVPDGTVHQFFRCH
jgi:hypothetical protein